MANILNSTTQPLAIVRKKIFHHCGAYCIMSCLITNKMSPKKMMQKYYEFKDYESAIDHCLSHGYKLPRKVSFERQTTQEDQSLENVP